MRDQNQPMSLGLEIVKYQILMLCRVCQWRMILQNDFISESTGLFSPTFYCYSVSINAGVCLNNAPE